MAKRRSTLNPQASLPQPTLLNKPERPVMTPFAEPALPEQAEAEPAMLPRAEQRQAFDIPTLESNVSAALKILDDTVMHAYVAELQELPLIVPYFDEESMKKDPYQFFHITKLVYEQEEFSVSKLAAVFQALSGKNCTLVLMVQNVSQVTHFYLGVREHDERNGTGTLRQMLEMSLMGQFPGSDFSGDFALEDMDKITQKLKKSTKAVSCVSCVPDYKQDKDFLENKDFLQGLEKFVISMQARDYTAVFVADAVPYAELAAYRMQLESVCTQLSPLAGMQIQISTSSSQSTANTEQSGQTYTRTSGETDIAGTQSSRSESDTAGEADSKSKTATHGTQSSTTDTQSQTKAVTEGTNESTTDGVTKTNTVTLGSTQGIGTFGGASGSLMPFGIGFGVNAGLSANVSLNESYSSSTAKSHAVTTGSSHAVTISDTVSKALTKGVSDSTAVTAGKTMSRSKTQSRSTGVTSQHGISASYSEAFSFGHAETLSDTFGSSQGITMQSQNMTILNMLERIRKQIVRLDECESIGMWNCSAYFMSSSRATSETAASTYRSLISGENSGVERSAINTWTDKKSLPLLSEYITHFCHPKFAYISGGSPCIVSPASLISTRELAIEMALPRKSVCGLPVIEHAVFGQQIIRNDIVTSASAKAKQLQLGTVYHLSTVTQLPVPLDIQSLTMHTFVTGSTGAGKSNTVYQMLDALSAQKIPYLVIEPSKGEYRKKLREAQVFGTNPNLGALLRLNPFAFPSEVHVQEHIDRLAELFNVCWEMYAAMPAVLKDAIIRAYESAGWNMNGSVNAVDPNLFPTFEDVLREIETVIRESDYSGDTSSDYKGALKTRLRSLTNGINGMVFSSREIPAETLFDQKTIVDLSRVGATETKALMMGVLVLKLQEYRMAKQAETDSALRHVTVLEEAHNLLKKTSSQQGQRLANLQGKSVEMLTNAIAEMRTYGEGFIIVDQAPELLDTAVIRNTNTKIVMRLPEGADREITGLSMALNEQQVSELSKLPQGVAAVYQNNWQEAVLCAVKKYIPLELPQPEHKNQPEYDEMQTLRLLLSSAQMHPELRQAILLSDAPAKIRRDLIAHFDRQGLMLEWAITDYIANRFRCSGIFAGTALTCNTLEELGERMIANLESVFPGFSRGEIAKICYYYCRKAHEIHPENALIEQVRVDYFKKRWMQ